MKAQFDAEDNEEYIASDYDSEEDMEDEEDEGFDEEDELVTGGAAKARATPKDAPEWATLKGFPPATQRSLMAILTKLKGQNKNELTIMLVGKNGVGKSSTGNSLLNEKVFNVATFQNASPGANVPQMVSRKAGGFTLSVIDTPGLLDGGSVNEESLRNICAFVADKTVDAIVYVDRLDTYRVQTVDKQIMEALTQRFGNLVWSITAFALTHGNVLAPAGMEYKDFVKGRVDSLRAAAKEAAGEQMLEVPCAVVENGSRCKTNADNEKILNDGVPWLSNFVKVVADLVGDGDVLDVEKALEGTDVHAKKNRWLVWPMLFAQIFLLKPLVCKTIEKDPNYN
uniref:AIG1-type G domain-containing protein n=1 Tax=Pyramimonas obovata TaxID=1411642 RepID=A0A7S0REM2_9CHLO|mmetsp:Transcript_32416/g.70777  ORF Transcript_32416/g.70777 Transcript_32416/m.70777 type:complete len:340 (+) Transcript_32416:137-1156(+)|eukprot:CAMPEP_0118930894 /NCGR_PEP_ID=MMETSP1169-20130426/7427_1 /TAXON_ID=36882 /ORGANISM="Pyramimonas obovata, Strain CCMP722" /LENGTH=339 /DNA_ID=CAMNT_0006873321 /DNA_START=123 /DNA_END=1142 /DNA_ORIENTATION=-